MQIINFVQHRQLQKEFHICLLAYFNLGGQQFAEELTCVRVLLQSLKSCNDVHSQSLLYRGFASKAHLFVIAVLT